MKSQIFFSPSELKSLNTFLNSDLVQNPSLNNFFFTPRIHHCSRYSRGTHLSPYLFFLYQKIKFFREINFHPREIFLIPLSRADFSLFLFLDFSFPFKAKSFRPWIIILKNEFSRCRYVPKFPSLTSSHSFLGTPLHILKKTCLQSENFLFSQHCQSSLPLKPFCTHQCHN